MRKIAVWGATLLVLAGCSGPRALSSASTAVEVMSATALPPPGRDDLVASARPYLIGPFDKLRIDVFGIEELRNREVQADASGRLSFPLIGVVEAAGFTPGELAQTITTRLRAKYIKDPQVTVNLTETVSQVVTVDGEVREPGLYPVIGRMTLMRAVATAKGITEFARQDDVVIFRTVQGRKLAALYNLSAIRKGVYEDPEVYASDVVVVGESRARRIFKDVLTIAPVLTTPLVVALQ